MNYGQNLFSIDGCQNGVSTKYDHVQNSQDESSKNSTKKCDTCCNMGNLCVQHCEHLFSGNLDNWHSIKNTQSNLDVLRGQQKKIYGVNIINRELSVWKRTACSQILWSICGKTTRARSHRIPQGEGGEQGDALMPLQAVSRQFRPNERLFAFLDDVYLTSKFDRVGACYTIFGRSSESMQGVEPSRSETSCVWRAGEIGKDWRSNSHSVEGSRISRGGPRDQSSGVAFGRHPAFVLLERPVCVVTSLPLCVCSRQLLAVSGPSFSCSEFRRDSRSCGVAVSGEHSENRFVRVFRGRPGCRHFAGCIGWVWSQEGHACQWSCSLGQLGRFPPHDPFSAPSCRHCVSSLFGRRCCCPLLECGQGDRSRIGEGWVLNLHFGETWLQEPGPQGTKWKNSRGCGTRLVHARHHQDLHIFPRLADPAKALLRSPREGLGVVWFSPPVPRLLLRRLQLSPSLWPCLPVWPPTSIIMAITALPALGLGFWEEGVCSGERGGPHLQRGWWPREYKRALAWLGLPHTHRSRWTPSRSGSGRVVTVRRGPSWRWTRHWWGALHCDGTARRGAAHNEGVAISMAERRKERRYTELVGRRARSRLVGLAVEVGGRWSPTTQHFISGLARVRARGEGLLLRRPAEQAWRLRWGAFLCCTAARAVADTFLELPGSVGADGDTPASHEVERDFAFAGLALWGSDSLSVALRTKCFWQTFSFFVFKKYRVSGVIDEGNIVVFDTSGSFMLLNTCAGVASVRMAITGFQGRIPLHAKNGWNLRPANVGIWRHPVDVCLFERIEYQAEWVWTTRKTTKGERIGSTR